jgi:hypothetical protein
MTRGILRPRIAAGLLALLLPGLAACPASSVRDFYSPGSVPLFSPVPARPIPEAEGPVKAAARAVRFRAVDTEEEPVAGVRIEVFHGKSFYEIVRIAAGSTGQTGEVRLAAVPCDVIVSATGRGFARNLQRLDGVPSGGEPLVLVMEKGRNLHGRTVDPSGVPVAGARVRVLSQIQRHFLRGSAHSPLVAKLLLESHGMYALGLLEAGLLEYAGARSDGEGRFVLEDLPAGWFGETVLGEDRVVHVQGEGRYPRVFRMKGIEVQGFEIVLEPMKASLRGAVIDEKGEPLPGCFVLAASYNRGEEDGLTLYKTVGPEGEPLRVSRPWLSGPTGADGRFLLTVPPGEAALKYVLCLCPGRVPVLLHDVEVGRYEGTDLEFRLSPGGDIRGEVWAEGKKVRPLGIRAGRVDPATVIESWFDMTVGGADEGGFRVWGMGNHDVYVRVDTEEHAPAFRILRWGGDPDRPRIRVAVRRGRTIQGRVFDRESGAGIAGAEVRAVLKAEGVVLGNPDFLVERRVFTGEGGRFALNRLPADLESGRIQVFIKGELRSSRSLPALGMPIEIGLRPKSRPFETPGADR